MTSFEEDLEVFKNKYKCVLSAIIRDCNGDTNERKKQNQRMAARATVFRNVCDNMFKFPIFMSLYEAKRKEVLQYLE